MIAATPPAPIATPAALSPGPAPAGYRVRLRFDPRVRSLEGTVAIRTRGARGPVWVRLRANRGGAPGVAACASARTRVAAIAGSTLVAARRGCGVVRVAPPPGAATLTLRVGVAIPAANDSFGRSLGVDLVGDVLPVMVAAGAGGPRLGPDPEWGEGLLAPVVPWDVSVGVPRGLTVVLPGVPRVRDGPGGRVFRSRARVRDAAIAVGALRARSVRVGRVDVRVVAAPGAAGVLPAASARAVRAFRFMQRRYGRYPLPRLTVVVGNLPWGGSEYPGVVFSTPDTATVSHEVAHQWFFSLVGNDQYRDPWLDESLTSFHEQLLVPGTYDCPRARPPAGLLTRGMGYWGAHPGAYERVVYRDGACAFVALQRTAGAAPLRRALAAYVAARAGGIAGARDLYAALVTAVPGPVVDAWWARYVGDPPHAAVPPAVVAHRA
ncbi:MAG: hypothetical protein KDC33_06765 [Thermoleophilia bacterium]|nr:hypothetical protein [Thermoleophilia bacterium]